MQRRLFYLKLLKQKRHIIYKIFEYVLLQTLSLDINKVSAENFQHPSRLKTRLAVLSTVFALFSKSKGFRAFISDFASSLATICALGVV